jgi:hypothetical protein
VYSNGTITNPGTFFPNAINDNGQIVANGSDATTNQAALLLTPA